MLYLKNQKSDSTQNWNAFWKIIVQDKFQVSKNFKQSFLRYIENTTGSFRNFAKCIYISLKVMNLVKSFFIEKVLTFCFCSV